MKYASPTLTKTLRGFGNNLFRLLRCQLIFLQAMSVVQIIQLLIHGIGWHALLRPDETMTVAVN